jgi:outer membrane protein assembly factor BamB
VATGKLRWKTGVGEVVTAPPVFGDSIIYIQSWGLLALESATGKVLWRAALGAGVQSAPVISGRTIFLASNGGELYALE